VKAIVSSVGNHSITFDYFVNDILKRNNGAGFKPQGTLEEFVQGFQVFDKDGNGFISAGELRYGRR
jgi:Ca2+-binding EF-hand superfamily protein